ncbi:hypothetical protein HBI49_127190 [Parastagonospora nodorum]|nr:hypothetical protein HBH74_199290 [Parastagonospora nodorum]KAH4945855.1 hypothetical protein HBH73_141350 [Parastagonospora nodorum]KAH5006298.1 hypothetical protein HBI74_219310 [Parastagonospora nodorum]KAH5361202.1 hypothetical protein HBI49_127190 [Parastagonospora nodorum]KAH5693770.1 hypothetical protein HBI44_147160 [Parastagonospora nodorum]
MHLHKLSLSCHFYLFTHLFMKFGRALCATRSCLLVHLHRYVHYQTKLHGRCSPCITHQIQLFPPLSDVTPPPFFTWDLVCINLYCLMSGNSASPAPRSRIIGEEFYQTLLGACIEGIQNFPVDRRPQNSATADVPNNIFTQPLHHNSTASFTSSQPPHRSTSNATMNRGPLHGAPPVRGQAPPPRGPVRGAPVAYGNQDARGNLAVQPAAVLSAFKFKKAAVKVVGAATARSSSAAASSSPVPRPVKAKPREVEHQEPVQHTVAVTSSLAGVASVSIKTELPTSHTGEESALDDLFARLNAQEASKLSSSDQSASPPRPKGNIFSFEDGPGVQDASSDIPRSTSAIEARETMTSNARGPITNTVVPKTDEAAQPAGKDETDEPESRESIYLRKAADYLEALPYGNSVPVDIIKSVSKKLRSVYAPNAKLSSEEAEKLKARYAFAIVNYVNKFYKKAAKPITSEVAKKALHDANGDMLRVCAMLVEEKYLSIKDMDSIAGLCSMINDALPKAEAPSALATPKPGPNAPVAAVRDSTSSVSARKDPLVGLTAWPTQEKRETPPAYRVCILKGVSGIKSINQLQALVWGGRLESLALPVPGSDFAVVRFLTPEACDKYFKATENGIEVQGDKKTLIFVEKQAGPTSINDTIRNCTEGDASRCIRALDADEDWSDMQLMKLARGKSSIKREVDRIKQGITARGRHYIDFRFASIYHALNFKQQLHQEEDWESCTIVYAPDPCEIAHSVHYQDEDGEATGFFA